MVKIIEPSYEILTDIETLNPLKMIEIASRTCYQSWDFMKEGSAEKLIKHLVEREHWAMIEHGGMITVRFIADRGLSHELVRHRLASFGQESTRFVDYSNEKHGGELKIIKPINCPLTLEDFAKYAKYDSDVIFDESQYTGIKNQLYARYGVCKVRSWLKWYHCMHTIEHTYFTLRKQGFSPQIARSVLPIGIKTEIVISANLREWHHIFELRTSKFAHPMIRTLMRNLLKEFKKKIPIIFDRIIVKENE